MGQPVLPDAPHETGATTTLLDPRLRDSDTDDELFHYVRKDKIVESAVMGNTVQALCGVVFPVTKTPKPGSVSATHPDIVRLKFSYYDYRKKEWHDDWDTKVVGMNYLPSHVHISLTVLDGDGRELTYDTDARIQLTDRVGYRN